MSTSHSQFFPNVAPRVIRTFILLHKYEEQKKTHPFVFHEWVILLLNRRDCFLYPLSLVICKILVYISSIYIPSANIFCSINCISDCTNIMAQKKGVSRLMIKNFLYFWVKNYQNNCVFCQKGFVLILLVLCCCQISMYSIILRIFSLSMR